MMLSLKSLSDCRAPAIRFCVFACFLLLCACRLAAPRRGSSRTAAFWLVEEEEELARAADDSPATHRECWNSLTSPIFTDRLP